jgi:hypothetical protein
LSKTNQISSVWFTKGLFMNEKQTDIEKVTAQPEMLPELIKWGLWPFWIFASMTVCGTLGSLLFQFGDVPIDIVGIMIVSGGFIGGIAVGLMPYLSQRLKISQARWWIWTLINLGLTATGVLIASVFFNSIQAWLAIMIVTIIDVIVALITRLVYRKWQTSKAGWSIWIFSILAVMLIVLLLPLSLISLYIFQQ